MTAAYFQQAKFVLGAAKQEQLPADSGLEVAFAGRSNAGKSSTLNVLTRQKNLARTSKTPGRTREINVFALDEDRRLIDLPGYGFAKVSQQIKENWQRTLNNYLQYRQSLAGLVVITDSRHPLKELDCQVIDWCLDCDLACHVLLTKADKLNRKNSMQALAKVQAAYPSGISAQLFSALNKKGLDTLEDVVSGWLGYG